MEVKVLALYCFSCIISPLFPDPSGNPVSISTGVTLDYGDNGVTLDYGERGEDRHMCDSSRSKQILLFYWSTRLLLNKNLVLHMLYVGGQNNLTVSKRKKNCCSVVQGNSQHSSHRQLVVSRNTAVRLVMRRLLEGGTSWKVCKSSQLARRFPGAWSTVPSPCLLYNTYKVLKQSWLGGSKMHQVGSGGWCKSPCKPERLLW